MNPSPNWIGRGAEKKDHVRSIFVKKKTRMYVKELLYGISIFSSEISDEL